MVPSFNHPAAVAEPSKFGHDTIVVGQLESLATAVITLANRWEREMHRIQKTVDERDLIIAITSFLLVV